jgi:hypothetical protein
VRNSNLLPACFISERCGSHKKDSMAIKQTFFLLFTLLTLLRCNDDETFNKPQVIEELNGEWIIRSSYEGFLHNGDTIRAVPINYPKYRMYYSTDGQITLYSMDGNVLAEGTFDINNNNEVIFAQTVADKLREIGYFDVDPAMNKYRLVKLNSTSLNIEYTRLTNDNEKQFDGFFIDKL